MKIRYYIFLSVILLLYHPGIRGQTSNSFNESRKLPAGTYISINPISLSAFIPTVATKEVFPYIHNLESGLSLASGYYYNRSQLEGRIVAGSPSALIFCPQIQLGYRYFPLKSKNEEILPLGFGLSIRAFDAYYTHSGIHFFNLSPQPQLEYVVRSHHFFFDFRLG